MSTESMLCMEVIEALEMLQSRLNDFTTHLQAQNTPIWLDALEGTPHLPSIINDRERAVWLYQQITYLPDQDPKAVLSCPGLIAADATLIEKALLLNSAKTRFQVAIQAIKAAKLKKDHPLLRDSLEAILNKRDIQVGHVLKRAGLARLQLKQCYRHVPLLLQHPKKVSWTWAHTTSIKRINVFQAEALLRKRGDDIGIQAQLSKLYTLHESEKLAIIQKLVPHLRANVVYQNGETVTRKMYRANIPLLYPLDPALPLPLFQPPKQKKGETEGRLKRGDQQVREEVFLPAIRAHRYL